MEESKRGESYNFFSYGFLCFLFLLKPMTPPQYSFLKNIFYKQVYFLYKSIHREKKTRGILNIPRAFVRMETHREIAETTNPRKRILGYS